MHTCWTGVESSDYSRTNEYTPVIAEEHIIILRIQICFRNPFKSLFNEIIGKKHQERPPAMSDDFQQGLYDKMSAASKKGRGGLGYDGPLKRSKVVESGGDGVEEVVKAVIMAGSGAEDGGVEDTGDGYDVRDVVSGPAAAAGSGDGARGEESDAKAGRLHPRNQYRDKWPNFAALAAKYPKFAA